MAALLRAEERLRQALEPGHIQLLSQISKLQGGVKDIVDMRNDLLVRRQSACNSIGREGEHDILNNQ